MRHSLAALVLLALVGCDQNADVCPRFCDAQEACGIALPDCDTWCEGWRGTRAEQGCGGEWSAYMRCETARYEDACAASNPCQPLAEDLDACLTARE